MTDNHLPKFYREQVRQHLDAIDRIISNIEDDDVRSGVIDVLCALRSCDAPSWDSKRRITNHIRKAALPLTCRQPGQTNWDTTTVPFSIADLDHSPHHFASHVRWALAALGLVPDASEAE